MIKLNGRDEMNIRNNLLMLLAIFCVVVSAGAVCAADYGAGEAQTVLEPGAGLPLENQTIPEPGAGLPLENQTGPVTGNATGNATVHTVGNVTGNATGNATGNVTGNATNATATHNSTLPTTGNPILALLAVTAIIGSYSLIRRNK